MKTFQQWQRKQNLTLPIFQYLVEHLLCVRCHGNGGAPRLCRALREDSQVTASSRGPLGWSWLGAGQSLYWTSLGPLRLCAVILVWRGQSLLLILGQKQTGVWRGMERIHIPQRCAGICGCQAPYWEGSLVWETFFC